LSAAIGHQKQWGGRLVNILINRGFVDEQTVISVLKKQLGVKSASLEGIKISQKALDKVKHDIAEKYCIMPIDLDNNKLSIAMSDPTDLQAIDELSFILGLNIEPLLASESGIRKAIAEHYTSAHTQEGHTI
ncbi:MAG: type II secretion system protein GspE, partial [Thermodesulfovibrionia bacterium]|nr:type II secretion system protein GspE [Thermodesulfovibrionia bacterium]